MSAIASSRNRIALMAVCLSATMLGLEITSIPAILPTLEHTLAADFRQLQWIMNAYTIAMCAMLIAMGALADRYGRKRLFMLNVAAFGVASLVCGLASNAPLLIAARFGQGVSAAGMLACQVAILSQQFREGPERGVAFSCWGVVFGLGLGTGPVVGGAILAVSSWQWVFLIHGVLALLTLALTQRGVQESADPHTTGIDIGGMITLPLAVFGCVYLITQGQELGLGSAGARGVLAASLACLLLFVVIERRAERPIFDFKAFGIRNFSGALLGACAMNFSFWPFIIYFPLYLQSALGYDGVQSGLIVLTYTLPICLVPPLAEKMLAKRGPGWVIPLGMFAIALGFGLLGLAVTTSYAGWASLLPGCLLAGAGVGLTTTCVTNTATGALPAERAGMASGMEFSARMISLSINIAVMGLILGLGVSWSLEQSLAPLGVQAGRALVDAICAGNFTAAEALGVPIDLARRALMQGIGWVLGYGASATLVLALLALRVFGKYRPRIHSPVADLAEGD